MLTSQYRETLAHRLTLWANTITWIFGDTGAGEEFTYSRSLMKLIYNWWASFVDFEKSTSIGKRGELGDSQWLWEREGGLEGGISIICP